VSPGGPGAGRGGAARRLLWFVGLYAAGVLVTFAVAEVLRALLI
jgi:hypothetical protein